MLGECASQGGPGRTASLGDLVSGWSCLEMVEEGPGNGPRMVGEGPGAVHKESQF